MKSSAVSVLLLIGGALQLGFCSGTSNGTSNGTGTTPLTPTTKGNVLTTVMNNTEPTTDMTTAETPTDKPNITDKAVTTTEGSNTTSMMMTTTMSTGSATTNKSTSVMPTTSTTPTTTTVPTTPTPKKSWKVMSGNKTCQLMRFSQNMTIKYYNTKGNLTDVNVSVPFEEPLSNVTGDCSSMKKRTFAIDFYPDGNGSADPWTLRFVFKTVNLTTFHLTSLSLELNYDNRFDTTEERQFVYSYSLTEDPPGWVCAPIGKSFSRKSLLISSADEKYGLSIVFEDVKLQPFADKAQGEFGESVPCLNKPDTQSNTWMVATTVVSVIFGVFFLGTVGFCYYVKKHQSAPSDTYSLMETY